MPEGQPRRDREQRGRAPDERWGPACGELSVRTAVLAAVVFALVLAAAISVFGLSLTPDRYLLVLLAPAVVVRRTRRYLLDFLPFAALILVYAEARGMAHVLRPDPYYLPQLHLERTLFGGGVPTRTLQQWIWSGHESWYDHLLLVVTRIHSIVPMTLAFVLWLRRRALFYRFAATMLVLSYSAALTFLLYPAAPPWEAARHGLLSVAKIGGGRAATSSVPAGDSLYNLIRGNPDAAIPSLHGGYAFLVFLFVAALVWRTRRRWPIICAAVLYPAVQSFAVVYTANHYVVDLLAGYAFATAAFVSTWWLWRRLRLPA
jgi:membrane-associated phospholipid phosphatase